MKTQFYKGEDLGHIDSFKKNEKWVIINFNTATIFPCKEWAEKFIQDQKETYGKFFRKGTYGSMSAKEFKEKYPNLNS